MSYFDKEQIVRAREMDLLTFLRRHDPGELVSLGNGVYSTRSHDSLKISNGLWNWWSRGIGGRSALDYLISVCGMKLPEAVALILNEAPPSLPAQSRSPPARAAPKAFVLPEPNGDSHRVFAYLRSRGIDPEIINHCIKHGLLYEEKRYHNAVFVGFDGMTPKFAMLRSTLSDSTFMQEVTGSDKHHSFTLMEDAPNGSVLFCYEGAIDLLSHATMDKLSGDDWRAWRRVSLGGIYSKRAGDKAPVVPMALSRAITSIPDLRRIVLCLDADSAGRMAAETIRAALPKMEIAYWPPRCGKDYNDLLCQKLGIDRRAKTRGGIAR